MVLISQLKDTDQQNMTKPEWKSMMLRKDSAYRQKQSQTESERMAKYIYFPGIWSKKTNRNSYFSILVKNFQGKINQKRKRRPIYTSNMNNLTRSYKSS